MAFPQIQFTNTSTETSSGTTHTVSLPATVAADDFLIIFAGIDGTPTVTAPTGFTKLIPAGSSAGLAVFVKKAAGTEGGTTVTFSTSAGEQSAHVSIAGDGWSEVLAEIEISTGASGSSANPDPDSVTASWGSDDNLFLAAFGGQRGDRTVNAFPTNYSGNQISVLNGNGPQGAETAIATRELASATDDPGTYTLSGSIAWGAATLVIRPSAVAPTGRIMSSLAGSGGLAGKGGIAGPGGGLAA